MSLTRFTIVRHGETLWNAEGRVMGHLDSPLSEIGREQARLLAGRLAGETFDAVYSSDLGRAVETANFLTVPPPARVLYDARLRERHMGIFQGLTLAEMRRQVPAERAAYERGGFEHVPGGESGREHLDRTMSCFVELAGRHPGASLLVVTHGGVLMALLRGAAGISHESARHFKRPNGAVNVFVLAERAWTLECWGDVSHLASLRALNDPNQ